jgi:cytochrome c
MKKILLLSLVVSIMSCGGKKETTAPAEEFSVPDNTPKVAVDDQVAQGEALIKGSDCKTCHHPVNKIIGPSHTEVAKKYEFTEANVKLLADKILKGGQGVWGQIPMTPHVDITQVDAEKMARYVLSLDGEKEH